MTSFVESDAGIALKVEDLHLDDSREEDRMQQELIAAMTTSSPKQPRDKRGRDISPILPPNAAKRNHARWDLELSGGEDLVLEPICPMLEDHQTRAERRAARQRAFLSWEDLCQEAKGGGGAPFGRRDTPLGGFMSPPGRHLSSRGHVTWLIPRWGADFHDGVGSSPWGVTSSSSPRQRQRQRSKECGSRILGY